jgi:hypothetical protein
MTAQVDPPRSPAIRAVTAGFLLYTFVVQLLCGFALDALYVDLLALICAGMILLLRPRHLRAVGLAVSGFYIAAGIAATASLALGIPRLPRGSLMPRGGLWWAYAAMISICLGFAVLFTLWLRHVQPPAAVRHPMQPS